MYSEKNAYAEMPVTQKVYKLETQHFHGLQGRGTTENKPEVSRGYA